MIIPYFRLKINHNYAHQTAHKTRVFFDEAKSYLTSSLFTVTYYLAKSPS